jgi:UDP-N-acetylglucosamine acyltransferase
MNISKINKISPQAVIEDGAVIGENVEIEAFAFISKDAVIGDNTKISHGACIYGKTTIGKNNEIFSYAVLGSIPQDLKYQNEEVELIIGDNNKIREFTLFNSGTKGGGSKTVIGNNNLFMGYVHVAHDCVIGNNCIFANAATLAGHVKIGNNAVIGGMTPIHQFVKVGDFAMVAGASAVSQDIPPYCLAEGNRATIKGLNLTGLRRFISREEIDHLKFIYKKIFREGESVRKNAEDILNNSEIEKTEYSINLLEFITSTNRGIPHEKNKNNN